MPMNRPLDELHAWLALAGGSNATRLRARKLLRHFGGPLEVFAAGRAQAQRVLPGEPCGVFFDALARLTETALRTQRWLASSPRHHVITLADPHYPESLLHSPDPPLVLHAIGQLIGLQGPAVAVVGSRHATPAGLQMADQLAYELASLGIGVVSGLAVGIDAAAHEAALRSAGLVSTVAVVGCGLHEVYPRRHQDLFARISERGIVVSEHPLGTPALPAFFPQRNRIIAGLSVAVVVVEATLRSGSLITARLAGEAGRDVFAVPGPLSSPQSAGCHLLIKHGAGLLESACDIIHAHPQAFTSALGAAASPERSRRNGRRSAPARASRTRPALRVDEAAAPKQGSTAEQELSLACHPTGSPVNAQAATVHRELPLTSSPRAGAASERFKLPAGLSAACWKRACHLLRSRPCSLEELSTSSTAAESTLAHALLLAELEGLVARLPGGLFQWCEVPA